jgi:hypothetical protein
MAWFHGAPLAGAMVAMCGRSIRLASDGTSASEEQHHAHAVDADPAR